jgi:hypothetical protein
MSSVDQPSPSHFPIHDLNDPANASANLYSNVAAASERRSWLQLGRPWFPRSATGRAPRCLARYDLDGPACSPLSCNGLAAEITTNRRCLFDSFGEARQSIETGKFDGSEPGPFRIFRVYALGF